MLDRAVPLVVDELLRRVDLDAVIARLDLAKLAEDVIASVDLPEIIRESTSAVSVRDGARGADAQHLRGRGGRSRHGAADAPSSTGCRRMTSAEGAPSAVPREARAYQGHRAGMVTRTVAAAVDAVVVLLVVAVGLLAVNGLSFVLDPRGFRVVGASQEVLVEVALGTAIVYLAGTWTVDGPQLRLPPDGPADRGPAGTLTATDAGRSCERRSACSSRWACCGAAWAGRGSPCRTSSSARPWSTTGCPSTTRAGRWPESGHTGRSPAAGWGSSVRRRGRRATRGRARRAPPAARPAGRPRSRRRPRPPCHR